MVKVTFWGVRGSTPCPSDATIRYGGNTACVAVEAPRLDPIVCDLGTGFRFYGQRVMADRTGDAAYRALVLVTHLHWDHIQGLPFFDPVHLPDTRLTIRGRAEEGSLERAFSEFMRPPFFPIRADELIGTVDFVDCFDETFAWGRARITARDVPHSGATNGYRIEVDGRSIAYLSDHQQPADITAVSEGVLDLCRDADLVIHDAQYEPEEFARKSDWGHCTVAYAVQVAAAAGAKRLALFHHDPSHDDDAVDRMLAEARSLAVGTGIEEVFAAYEGLTVEFAEVTEVADLSAAAAPAGQVLDAAIS
jgi:phosphoribosyl 1,2-cyclic phosphodiesterase